MTRGRRDTGKPGRQEDGWGGPEATAHSSPFTAQRQAVESFWENMTSLSLAVCCPPASLSSVVLLMLKVLQGDPHTPGSRARSPPQPLSLTIPLLLSLPGAPT